MIFLMLLYILCSSDIVSAGGAIKRHFYINEGYYGCANDQGWVLVVDGPGPCLMDQVSTTTIYFVNTASYSLMPGGKCCILVSITKI